MIPKIAKVLWELLTIRLKHWVSYHYVATTTTAAAAAATTATITPTTTIMITKQIN